MYNAFGGNENENSNSFAEMYSRRTKKESNLGRRGMTERPIRIKTLLSELDLNKLDEERSCNENNGSLICANDSVLNEFNSSGEADGYTADSFANISMEVDGGHSSCLSSSETLPNSFRHCSQGSGTFKEDYSETFEAGCSHRETQKTDTNETITHPPIKSAVSFCNRTVISKDILIQNSLTLDSRQKFMLTNHSTSNKLPPPKETEKPQLPPFILNKDLASANPTPLKDIANNSDVVISRMRTPFKAINTLNYTVPVSESQTLNPNSSSLYNKENVLPAPLTPFIFSTPAKSESIGGQYQTVFTANAKRRNDGQGPFTPLPGTAYKPLSVPSTITPARENIQTTASVFQQFSNNGPASEGEFAVDLSSKAGIVGDDALHEVGSSSSRVVQNDACQPRKEDRRYLLVNGKSYKVECLLGRGGSSKVYQVLHPDTSEHLAIKCVNLSDTEPEIAQGYHNEIKLLKKLQGSENIVRMFDYEYVPEEQMLYMVLEKGEIDLSKLLKSLSNTSQLSISTVISYWLEMLAAVKSIHINGIIHSDLKPGNFLVVNGHLKLIDFGIASSLQNGMTSVSKDIATGTFNYMSPEAIQEPTDSNGNNPKIKINYKSDIWSLGCILYNLLYGKTPFQHIKQVWAKLACIKNSRTQIQYPPLPEGCPGILLKALKLCLQYDPKQRPSAEELQQLPYQCYHHMESLLNKIKQEVLGNPNSEDLKAIKALICKHHAVFE